MSGNIPKLLKELEATNNGLLEAIRELQGHLQIAKQDLKKIETVFKNRTYTIPESKL